MPSEAIRDFASMLDELLTEHKSEAAGTSSRAASVDYLSAIDELHSGRITISRDAAAGEYETTTADVFESVSPTTFVRHKVVEEPLPPIDQPAIERELGLSGRAPEELDALRRRFARANHPDSVGPGLRERAMIRMQIANMLIDEAKRKAVNGPTRVRGARA